MERYFAEKALLQMRQAIAEAGGNEVFFLGRTDEARRVVEVEPLARGNRDAVAAILIAASFGDVVIHNHPSGNLTPSTADLEIAAILGNQGVGFYLVNNGVTECYQAVAPFARRERVPLSYPEIEEWYAPGGVFARNLPGYEHRAEQVRMAFAVAEACNGDRVAVIEAGTGTGKSLAYLLPAVLWAVRNRERVVVSTNTINLQEQLIKKDIPFLQEYGGLAFRAVLVKGRANYLCLRKLASVRAEPSLFKDEADELQAIIDWSSRTADGCRSDLAVIPRDEVWEEVCCEADQCGRVTCPFYQRCFLYAARREAAGADLLVVNHALLMSDLALRRETGYDATAILPPFTRLVLDEAHHLEDVATSHLSAQLTRPALLKILGRLQHPRKPQRGLLPQLSARLSREVPEELDDLYRELAGLLEDQLLPRRGELAEAITRTFDGVAVALQGRPPAGRGARTELQLRLKPVIYGSGFWQEVAADLRKLAGELTTAATQITGFLKAVDRLPEAVLAKLAGELVDLKGVRGRLETAAAALLFFVAEDPDFCRWFEPQREGKARGVKLCAAPLEVAGTLREVLLDRFRTVILTSATLAVGESFTYLAGRTGITLLDPARVTELLLASPFDYARQALVGIPADLPEPTQPGFAAALCPVLEELLEISRGRAFVLFTSYDLLIKVYEALREPLGRRGLTPLRQGELNRHHLLARFRTGQGAVLFGTDSFWEGVDVQGEALQLVVITRLPFRVPTDPILEARAEQIEARGGDAFRDYTVPQAVLKFKQGFGRLIRSREDRGAVVILDRRVLSKSYGASFLRSLPETQRAQGESREVLAAVRDFFSSFAVSPAARRTGSTGSRRARSG